MDPCLHISSLYIYNLRSNSHTLKQLYPLYADLHQPYSSSVRYMFVKPSGRPFAMDGFVSIALLAAKALLSSAIAVNLEEELALKSFSKEFVLPLSSVFVRTVSFFPLSFMHAGASSFLLLVWAP
mmetsp:Transcript_27464/g.44669  ORF Transcript_27464/g.44669 Transcript_27464/m.44669 type:complete len:125 (+) Transcript_27464:513-887(+)